MSKTRKRQITDLPTEWPPITTAPSSLIDETKTMERQRRLREQDGHRKLARVHAREHGNEQYQNDLQDEYVNGPLQHPDLATPRFDGVDRPLNALPQVNDEGRMEFDNERREQEKEKQLRLGNMPKFNSAPKPQGP